MKQLHIVLKKELNRIFTDKRLVFTNFILPAISLLVMYSVIGFLTTSAMKERTEYKSKIISKNAPEELVQIIEKSNIGEFISKDVQEATARSSVLSKKNDIYLSFEENFETKILDFKSGKSKYIPKVTAYFNEKSQNSKTASNKIYKAFKDYKTNLLLVIMNLNELPKFFDLEVKKYEFEEDSKPADSALAMILPMLLSIFVFAGAMGVGIDIIAGEKERGTLAIMFLSPIDRSVFIIAKTITLAIVSAISTMSSIIGIIASLPFSKSIFSSAKTSSSMFMSLEQIGAIFLILIGISMVSVSAIVLLSLISKTVKEAGTYITPLYMLVMMASMSTMFSQGKEPLMEMFFVPFYGSVLSITKILNGEISLFVLITPTIVSIITTVVLILLQRKIINNENTVFPT